MSTKNIFLGNTLLKDAAKNVEGEFVEINNEKFYKISNYNEMADFFMTIVSVSDHWMFISSNGALSAGRKNRDNALFPYYCVDKIHDYYDITGSKTIALAEKGDKTYLWEPFSKKLQSAYTIERNIFKSIYANKILFEEKNLDLGLIFQYSWNFTEKFGFVKRSTLINDLKSSIKVDIIDGIKNVLPYGFDSNFQLAYSNLLDAYKKSELHEQTKLGIFSLSSIPVDRAEPSEALKATTVWSGGLKNDKILISENQLDSFTKGISIETEVDKRATRGAYFVNELIELKPDEKKEWIIVAEINQDSADVANLIQVLKTGSELINKVSDEIAKDTQKLRAIVARADGLQLTNEELTYARHYSNTLYNIMRGGIFINGYKTNKIDFVDYISNINKNLKAEFHSWIERLPSAFSNTELIEKAEQTNNFDLIRICCEYLPLTFSRRHGDPSRPWNQFSIETETIEGVLKSDYQGNWRDIFQNWEALALSYPAFTEQMITKFVNASTADGYNPYRVTRNGLDWEKPDPDDPWAYIGYWGDHQIIYLQKLLEISSKYNPGELEKRLNKNTFVYANVPYRIKPYADIVKNPQDTIEFDYELDKEIELKFNEIGADGKLLTDTSGNIYRVTLTEKLLVTLLAKLSNFIPEAGIWLNTQRPEWNDANNALVGNGVSMVTLYYIRRFLKFWIDILDSSENVTYEISEEVNALLEQITQTFTKNRGLLSGNISDSDRRKITNELGLAGSNYRNKIYNYSYSGKKNNLKNTDLKAFYKLSLEYINHSIKANKRTDGLYHAYNLVSFSDSEIEIRYLYEMLEGQVAVLTSGYLTAIESLELLDALKESKMFREDQYSYLLYPDRTLPLFIERNNIPKEAVESSELLKKMLNDGNPSIINQDHTGSYHFSGSFRNAEVLTNTLMSLNGSYKTIVEKEIKLIQNIYEKMFNHKSFTGRSGTFYGFEGLGSIYWHMVSKLLLVAQEAFYQAIEEHETDEVLERLKAHYYEIKAGIGLYKSPKLYGAFPTDAYSHTPGHAGAQQPGMTGQVKEDFIARFGELGLTVNKGAIHFKASLINENEFMHAESEFRYISIEGKEQFIKLKKGQFAFTFCGVPVVYEKSSDKTIELLLENSIQRVCTDHTIPTEYAEKIFQRTGVVKQILVKMPL